MPLVFGPLECRLRVLAVWKRLLRQVMARGLAGWGSDLDDCRLSACDRPVITRERSERVVSEVIGEQERRIYALFHHDVFPPPPGLWEQGVPLGSG